MIPLRTFRLSIDEDGTPGARVIECRYLNIQALAEYDRLASSDSSADHIAALKMVITAVENMDGDLETNLTQREAHLVSQAIPLHQTLDEQKKSSFKWLWPSSGGTSAQDASGSVTHQAVPGSTALPVVDLDVTGAATVGTGDSSGVPASTSAVRCG